MNSPHATLAEMLPRARQAAVWWGAAPIRERARLLLAFRKRLVADCDRIVGNAQHETGKPRFDLVGELMQVCTLIGYCARHGPRVLRPRKARAFPLLHKRAEVHCQPLGVVGIITPFNYPITLVLAPVVQALIAGNAAIVKPSPQTVQTARTLCGIFSSLDIREPVFQLLEGGSDAAIALAESRVDKIAFTGSAEGGLAIAAAAARNLTPVLLELGGNDAMLIARDADVERAAGAAVWGAFLNAGQSCIAVSRCYVEAPIADAFIERVATLTSQLALRPVEPAFAASLPTTDDYDVGALRTDQQFERVSELVADATSKGARIVAGGFPEIGPTRVFPPTVIVDVDHRMRILREETFGPVLPIMRVADMDEAIRLANDTPYGLSASLWTANVRKGKEWALGLRVGGAVINDCLVHFAIPDLPFGGVGASGYGRSQGREGLLEYCRTQTITRHRFGPRREFHWFPYGSKYRMLSRIMKWMYG